VQQTANPKNDNCYKEPRGIKNNRNNSN